MNSDFKAPERFRNISPILLHPFPNVSPVHFKHLTKTSLKVPTPPQNKNHNPLKKCVKSHYQSLNKCFLFENGCQNGICMALKSNWCCLRNAWFEVRYCMGMLRFEVCDCIRMFWFEVLNCMKKMWFEALLS